MNYLKRVLTDDVFRRERQKKAYGSVGWHRLLVTLLTFKSDAR
jgi:hypothetical protein